MERAKCDKIKFMIKTPIKIIFTDIDWTILDHKKHDWDYESIHALKQAQDNGVLVYLCTARPYDSIVHTGLFEIFHPDGVICTNGGVCFIKDELLFANVIPCEIVREVERIANRHHLVLELGTDKDRYFTSKANCWVHKYFANYAETIPYIKRYHNENVTSILLFAPEKYDEILIKEFPKELRYCRYDAYGVDVCYYLNSKSSVKKVLETLNITKDKAMSFGDDYADIAMFNETKYSICVGDYKKEVKNQASDFTESVSNGGVAKALRKYRVI